MRVVIAGRRIRAGAWWAMISDGNGAHYLSCDASLICLVGFGRYHADFSREDKVGELHESGLDREGEVEGGDEFGHAGGALDVDVGLGVFALPRVRALLLFRIVVESELKDRGRRGFAWRRGGLVGVDGVGGVRGVGVRSFVFFLVIGFAFLGFSVVCRFIHAFAKVFLGCRRLG